MKFWVNPTDKQLRQTKLLVKIKGSGEGADTIVVSLVSLQILWLVTNSKGFIIEHGKSLGKDYIACLLCTISNPPGLTSYSRKCHSN